MRSQNGGKGKSMRAITAIMPFTFSGGVFLSVVVAAISI